MSSTVAGMNDPASRLANDADALRLAAQRLHDHALDPVHAAMVPVALAAIEDALIVLSRASYAVANEFVPLGNSDESITTRFDRAATTWPAPRGGVGPSHEQQARVLASLNDAGAALRTAAGHCGRAARNLAATMEPVADPPDEYQRRSESA
jgi:hypothetical protein